MSLADARSTIGRRRLLRAAWAATVGAAVIGAAATVFSGVQGWRTADASASSRSLFLSARAGALREAAVLESASTRRAPQSGRRAFFAAAAQETSLLASLQQSVSASQQALVARLEKAHAGAVADAARALSGKALLAKPLRNASAQLDVVQRGAAQGQNDVGYMLARPWPSTLAQRLGLLDTALVLLLGAARILIHLSRVVGLREAASPNPELERLSREARTDSLTGLANHRAFEDDLRKAIELRNTSTQPFSLLAFDLDGLKQINDGEGHGAGDRYITTVARCIRDQLGGQGTVYRTGGDEFMAILPNARAWNALMLAQTIQRETHVRVGRRALSIGVAESTRTEGRKLLLHQADVSLYEAKRSKLLAVTYHAGLEPSPQSNGAEGPSHYQKTLAAALAQAVDAKDSGTRNHSETVADLAVALGARLGLEGQRLERLRVAGLLHDVGKIGISDAVLAKPGVLDRDERAEIEMHAVIGHSILVRAELHEEAHWVLHHHERFDGRGYPAGLAGEDIPLEARIIAVADAFEAMTGERSYRETLTPDAAVAELFRNSGTQFDPRCVEALDELFGGDAEAPPAAAAGMTAIEGAA